VFSQLCLTMYQAILISSVLLVVLPSQSKMFNRVFNEKKCSIQQVVDKIKSTTFMWLKGKYINLPLNYHGWWLSPFTILGIG